MRGYLKKKLHCIYELCVVLLENIFPVTFQMLLNKTISPYSAYILITLHIINNYFPFIFKYIFVVLFDFIIKHVNTSSRFRFRKREALNK